jgi:EmrB/QacA subfamily drug resistance transporter
LLPMQSPDDARRKTLILVLCCLAQFMVILDVSVVNVALPSIRDDLGFSATDLQWVVNAYTLTFAGFLLLGGRAADLLGRRRVFVAGLALFALASLAGALSTSQGMLVVARGVQGLGGAIVAPATLSILTTSFAEGAERNRALAAWGAMGGAGGAAGGLLGGVLTELLGWQWILLVNVPIGVVAAVAASRVIAESAPASAGRREFDLAGALSVTAGLIVLTFGIVRTDVNGWTSVTTLATLAAGLALLGGFLAIEGRFAHRPLVPLRIFESRTVAGANLVVFALGASVFAMWYFVSLYLQQVLGYTPIEAGLAFLPMTAAIIIASTMAGRLVARLGAGTVLATGMTCIGIGMLLFGLVRTDGTYLADVLGPSLITALGIGLAFVPVTIAATSGVARAEAGLASGLVNTSRQVGGSLGLAVLATLAQGRTAGLVRAGAGASDALTTGFHRAFVVGGGFGLAGALLAVTVLGRIPRPGAQREGAPARVDA